MPSGFLDEARVHKRFHSWLGYLVPAELEEQWRCEQRQIALFTKNRSEGVQSQGATGGDYQGIVVGSILSVEVNQYAVASQEGTTK